MAYTIQFVRTLEEMALVEIPWKQVVASRSCSPNLSYEWIYSIIKNAGPNEDIWIGIIWQTNEMVGIVPLEMGKERVGAIHISVMRILGEGWGCRNNLHINSQMDDGTLMPTLLEALRCAAPQWKYCRLGKVPRESAILRTITEKSQRQGKFVSQVAPIGESVVIELPETWESYIKMVSRSHKKNIGRRMNGLKRVHELRLLRTTPGRRMETDLIERLIADAIEVSSMSWQGSAITGKAISDEDIVKFFRDVSKTLASTDMLDLSLLYADEEPISFIWGIGRWPKSTILKLGFKRKYSQHSPGLVHLAMHVRDSIEKGVREIDFGHEYGTYKRMWGKRYDPLVNIYYYPDGLLPRLIRYYRTTKAMARSN